MKMNRSVPICVAALFPMLLQAQGLVNVNNRGLNPDQLVTDGNGMPVAGTHLVAQIVYGRDAASMTNVLGDPMPFRTGILAGTWNPSPNSVRTLNGFTEGQTVLMQVFAWDSSVFLNLEQVRSALAGGNGGGWACQPVGLLGASSLFSYVVGSLPENMNMANFRSFQIGGPPVFPSMYIADVLGGPWVRRVDAAENAEVISINLLNLPPTQFPTQPVLDVNLPPDTDGNEPLGWAIRSVTAGNPLNLVRPASAFTQPQTITAGFTETVELTPEQALAETSLVSVEGTVSNAIIRLNKPFVGRVVLQLRYPLNPQLPPGCVSAPRNIIVDLKPVGTPARLTVVSNMTPGLRLKLESGPTHRISRSFDLVTWETIETCSVGYPMCIPQVGPPSCGVQLDLDEVSRFGDFTIPIQGWLPTNGTQRVFFRLESQ